jgi:hypothetical protein
MEIKETAKISFIILMITMIMALIVGIVATFLPDILISRSFPLYTGQQWNDLLSSNSVVGNYILIKERMMGAAWLAASICGLFVLFAGFRKAEKWAWYCVLILILIAWGAAIIEGIVFNNTPVIVIAVVALLLASTGLIMSARALITDNK